MVTRAVSKNRKRYPMCINPSATHSFSYP